MNYMEDLVNPVVLVSRSFGSVHYFLIVFNSLPIPE